MPDPYTWFINLLLTEKPPYFNLSYYSNPALDKQINQVETLVATNPAAGSQLYHTMQVEILQQAPLQALYNVNYQYAMRTSFTGFVVQPGLRERRLRVQPQADRQLIVYVARRVALAVLVVAGVIVLTFVIAHVGPRRPGGDMGRAARLGGPGRGGAPVPRAGPAARVQLLSYFGGILTGNWGVAIHTHRPVLSDIAVAAPASLELVTAALIIALVVAVPLGLVSARWPGRAGDHAIRAGSILGVSMPIFWMALILQLVFAQRLHLLPVAGEYSPSLLFTHPLHPADRVRPDRCAAHRELADARQHARPSAAARRGRGRLPGRPDRPHGPGPGAGHRRRRPRADGPRAGLPRAGRLRPLRR